MRFENSNPTNLNNLKYKPSVILKINFRIVLCIGKDSGQKSIISITIFDLYEYFANNKGKIKILGGKLIRRTLGLCDIIDFITLTENIKWEINLLIEILCLYFKELTGIKFSLLIILFFFKECENLQ